MMLPGLVPPHRRHITGKGEKKTHETNRFSGKSSSSSTFKIQQYMKSSEAPVWAAVMNTKLDFCMGWLSPVMNLDEDCEHNLCIPASGARFLFSGKA